VYEKVNRKFAHRNTTVQRLTPYIHILTDRYKSHRHKETDGQTDRRTTCRVNSQYTVLNKSKGPAWAYMHMARQSNLSWGRSRLV